MDALVSAALVGTARQPREPLCTGTPVDAFVAALPEISMERRLLLSAGAYVTYRAAGRAAGTAPAALDPCPRDSRSFCSPGAAQLLTRLLAGEHEELLPEAVRLLRDAGQVLSPAILLQALEVRNPQTQQALLGVLGQRGRWLARFFSAREWALVVPPEEDSALGDEETLWQEGTQPQRVWALRRLRLTDPDRARQLLADGWPRESEEFRLAMLRALETNLTNEDEPLLEAALDRCTRDVREQLIAMLARLPHSAFAARMRERADSMLTYEHSVLSIKPPTACPSDGRRDGISAVGPKGTDQRAWWLMRVLAYVPPVHWEQRFGATAEALVGQAALMEWGRPAIEAWSWAALLQGDSHWMPMLWDWWAGMLSPSPPSLTLRGTSTDFMRKTLIGLMPRAEAEARAWDAIARIDMRAHPVFYREASDPSPMWTDIAGALPAPWSHEFGVRYLRKLGESLSTMQVPDRMSRGVASPGLAYGLTLRPAALALPPSCFSLALEICDWPEDNPRTRIRVPDLAQFVETLRLRQRLFEEIHS